MTDLYIVSIELFQECHIVGTIQYAAFSNWLLSLNNASKVLPCLQGLIDHFLFPPIGLIVLIFIKCIGVILVKKIR